MLKSASKALQDKNINFYTYHSKRYRKDNTGIYILPDIRGPVREVVALSFWLFRYHEDVRCMFPGPIHNRLFRW